MTENTGPVTPRADLDAATAASMAFETPMPATPMTTLPHYRPQPTARAAMTAEPNVPPPSIHELEDECLTAYAIIVRGRRRLTEAEARLSAAVRAAIRAGRL